MTPRSFKKILYIDIRGILLTFTILLILRVRRMDVGFQKVFLMQNLSNLTTSDPFYIIYIGAMSFVRRFELSGKASSECFLSSNM